MRYPMTIVVVARDGGEEVEGETEGVHPLADVTTEMSGREEDHRLRCPHITETDMTTGDLIHQSTTGDQGHLLEDYLQETW